MSDNQSNNMDVDDVQISVEANDEISDTAIEATDETSDDAGAPQDRTPEQVQQQTFSHSPHSRQFAAQLMQAGFHYCNVRDRVICLSCNLVFEQWAEGADDPCEVHRVISPNCRYVQSKLQPSGSLPSAPPLINTDLSRTVHVATSPTNPSPLTLAVYHETVVLKLSHHPQYADLPERVRSFADRPNKNLPPIDDLARAGFFYTGVTNIVTCFYCDGSLCNWNSKANPMLQHVRHFPNCAYARQLCGEDLYERFQQFQRARKEQSRTNVCEQTSSSNRSSTSNLTINRLADIPDENLLSRLVAARLNLPISQNLLNMKFRLAVVKRCWEDQLRIKGKDFASEADLLTACTILQGQIERIQGRKENIIIPSVKMRQIRQQEEARRLLAISQTWVSRNVTNRTSTNEPDEPLPSNLCVLCLTEEKQLACLPCGHLVTCVPCGHSLRCCPLCGREVQTFVRIYS